MLQNRVPVYLVGALSSTQLHTVGDVIQPRCMPADGQVRVAVLDTRSHKLLAAAKVTLAGRSADTNMGDLELKNR